MNAAWAVHWHHDAVWEDDFLLLYSAAYGRYLAATDAPAPRGGRGRRVVQRNHDHPEFEAMFWYAALSESGDEVCLHHFHGGSLRANTTYPYLRWTNSISVDDTGNVTTMMHWVVEDIPAREGMPPLPPPTGLPFAAAMWRWRVIQYVWPNVVDRGSFLFWGRSVFHLRDELARRLAIDVSDLVMCFRTDAGRVTPLLVDLPRNHETLVISVVIVGTPG
ncbi:uncharacterized protein [Triticum aestivum]|uniref:uncharacterized protein n=1 Tax=Triticum aestivum TaxID=4565 RepID=UPI001D013DED|nr:uncharacterized protein LOC123147417 [Triticum aestivum]